MKYVVLMNDKKSNSTYTKDDADKVVEYLKNTFPNVEVKKEQVNENRR